MTQTPHVPPSAPPPPPPTGGSYTPPPPPSPGGPASSDRQIMLVLSYLGILSLIPLLAKKNDPEVQWHAKNGTVLFFAELIWFAIGFVFLFVAPNLGFLGCGWGVIRCVVWLGFLALSVYCIVQAVGGKRPRIPVITDMAEKM